MIVGRLRRRGDREGGGLPESWGAYQIEIEPDAVGLADTDLSRFGLATMDQGRQLPVMYSHTLSVISGERGRGLWRTCIVPSWNHLHRIYL